VGITSPEQGCSTVGPGDARGNELGREEEAEYKSWSSAVRCGSMLNATTNVGADMVVEPGVELGLSRLRFPAFQCHRVDPSIKVSEDTLLSSLSKIAREQYRQEDERALRGRFSCPVPLTDARLRGKELHRRQPMHSVVLGGVSLMIAHGSIRDGPWCPDEMGGVWGGIFVVFSRWERAGAE